MVTVSEANIVEGVSFENALSQTGYGKFNYFLLLTVGVCLLGVISDTQSMGFVLPATQCDLNLTVAQKGLLNAISFLGVVCGGHFLGFLADVKGRRKIIKWSIFFNFTCTVITSFVSQLWLFTTLRFVSGFFMAAPSAVIYAYFGEFLDNERRPKMLTWSSAFCSLGLLVLPVFSWIILPMTWSFDVPLIDVDYKPWRLLLVVCGMPGLLAAIGLIFLPESPKFLWANGNNENALEVLKTVYHCNTGLSKDSFPVKQLIPPDVTGDQSSRKKSFLNSIWEQTVPIFRIPYGLKTLMLCILQFGLFLTASGFYSWFPEILKRISDYQKDNPEASFDVCTIINWVPGNVSLPNTNFTISHSNFKTLLMAKSDNPTTECSGTVNTDVFKSMMVIAVVFAIIYFLIGSIINIFGKKNTLLGLVIPSALSGFLVIYASSPALVTILLSVFVVCGAAIGVTNTFTVDFYPTYYRAMAISISLTAGRLGAMTGSNIVGIFLEYNCQATFYVFGGELLVCAIIAALLPCPQAELLLV